MKNNFVRWARLVSIALGAAPATLLALMSVIFGAAGGQLMIGGFLDNNRNELFIASIVVAWFVFVVWGTFSLWVAALGRDPIAHSTMLGLVAGLVAISPIALSLHDDPLRIWWSFGPPVIAVWHLWRYAQGRVLSGKRALNPD